MLLLLTGCNSFITKYEEPAAPYTIFFKPAFAQVTLDSTSTPEYVDLKIMIDKVTDLFAMDLNIEFISDSLNYSQGRVNVVAVQEGTMLAESGTISTIFYARHPINGNYINIQGVRLHSNGVTTYEPAHLATIRLEPKAAGSVLLHWSKCQLIDSTSPNGSVIDPENHFVENAVVNIQY
jgi:hypothetical protein